MINFIIKDDYDCENKIIKTIDSYMMNYDIEVKYHLIKNIDELKEQSNKINSYKVYVLNLDTEKDIDLSYAKYIREEQNDWNSIIIVITNHNEMKYEVVNNRLFLFDFIYRNIYFDKRLKEDLKHIKSNYDNREKCLIFESNRIISKVDFKCINVIEKEKNSKRCKLKSSHGNYFIPETLNKIEKRLDERFIKVNRSCIVNCDEINEIDLNDNKIYLKCCEDSYDISRDNRKKVSSYFDNYK